MSFIEEELIDPRALCTFTSGVLLLAPIILVFSAIAITIEVSSVINRRGLAHAGSWFVTEG